jgi:hypothetical protein
MPGHPWEEEEELIRNLERTCEAIPRRRRRRRRRSLLPAVTGGGGAGGKGVY